MDGECEHTGGYEFRHPGGAAASKKKAKTESVAKTDKGSKTGGGVKPSSTSSKFTNRSRPKPVEARRVGSSDDAGWDWYESYAEAARKLKFTMHYSTQAISKCVAGIQKQVEGFEFRAPVGDESKVFKKVQQSLFVEDEDSEEDELDMSDGGDGCDGDDGDDDGGDDANDASWCSQQSQQQQQQQQQQQHVGDDIDDHAGSAAPEKLVWVKLKMGCWPAFEDIIEVENSGDGGDQKGEGGQGGGMSSDSDFEERRGTTAVVPPSKGPEPKLIYVFFDDSHVEEGSKDVLQVEPFDTGFKEYSLALASGSHKIDFTKQLAAALDARFPASYLASFDQTSVSKLMEKKDARWHVWVKAVADFIDEQVLPHYPNGFQRLETDRRRRRHEKVMLKQKARAEKRAKKQAARQARKEAKATKKREAAKKQEAEETRSAKKAVKVEKLSQAQHDGAGAGAEEEDDDGDDAFESAPRRQKLLRRQSRRSGGGGVV
jgi:hypothetical protein